MIWAEPASTLAAPMLFAFATVFFRVAAMIAVLPLLGERLIPIRLRLGAAIMLSLLLFSMNVVPVQPVPEWAGAFRLIATESLTGLFLGVLTRILFMALQVAGSIAAQATSLAQIFPGQNVEPLPAIGHVLAFGALAYLAGQGALPLIAEFGAQLYQVLPAGHLIEPDALATWGLAQVGQCFGLALRLSAPFILVALLYYLAMGAINRAMPQLMVALVGAPLVTFVSLGVLAIIAPAIIFIWHEAYVDFLMSPLAAFP